MTKSLPASSLPAEQKRPRYRKTRFLLWNLAIVSAVCFGTEGCLSLLDRGLPNMNYYWDASDLVATPVFVDNERGMLTTDPLLVRADNTVRSFSAHKAPNALRMFCVGASTTAGWPFHQRSGYPHWL